MGRAKTGWIALMVLIVGLNGLFGGSGIAALCFHASTDVHLVIGGHETGHLDCGDADCEGSNVVEGGGLEQATVACEEGCFDLSLKGIDHEFTLTKRLLKTPEPQVVERALIFTGSAERRSDERIRIQLPPRGPPLVNTCIVRIKTTVLRV